MRCQSKAMRASLVEIHESFALGDENVFFNSTSFASEKQKTEKSVGGAARLNLRRSSSVSYSPCSNLYSG